MAELSLTPAQTAQFHADGVVQIDRIIDDETVEALRRAYDRLFRGEFTTGVTPDEVNWQDGAGDPSLTRQICNGWKADPEIARIMLREDFGRVLAGLTSWPGIRIMTDNVLWKPPGARPLGYHQDNAYLSWFRPQELISLWIALDDTSADGGLRKGHIDGTEHHEQARGQKTVDAEQHHHRKQIAQADRRHCTEQ